MICKKIKFLISFLFLLSNNSNFQGSEQTKSIQKLFQESSEKFKPKSILKQRGNRNPYSDKKVIFSNFVEILNINPNSAKN